MADRNRRREPQWAPPPDLRGLAHRPSIDPAEMPTVKDDWAEPMPEAELPPETLEAEVEVVASTTEAVRVPVPVRPLGPPVRRRVPVPILTADQAREGRWTPSRWVGSVLGAAVVFGLLGGIGFALGAVWVIEPEGTERWIVQIREWLPETSTVVEVPLEDGLDAVDSEDAVAEVPPAEVGPPPEPEEPVEATPEPEPPPAAPEVDEAPIVPPRRRVRRRVPLPTPVAIPKPAPVVKPYEQRPVIGPDEFPPVPSAEPGDKELLPER